LFALCLENLAARACVGLAPVLTVREMNGAVASL
jgi:hypothetical protein